MLCCTQSTMHMISHRARLTAAPPAGRKAIVPPRYKNTSWDTSAQRRVHAMASSADLVDHTLEVVNRQLQLYNARDLDNFMELFADNILVTDLVSGTVLAKSKAELRPRYVERFKTPVHCELLGRVVLGNVVVDREIVTGLPDNGVADCMATYVVENKKIAQMKFVWKPRTPDVKL